MAEKMLSEKLGEVEYDGLIAGVNPKKRVGPGVIAGPEAETTFVRGTVFAKSAKDGKLHILGTEASGGDTLTADCILIEDEHRGCKTVLLRQRKQARCLQRQQRWRMVAALSEHLLQQQRLGRRA